MERRVYKEQPRIESGSARSNVCELSEERKARSGEKRASEEALRVKNEQQEKLIKLGWAAG